jgi:hypothetical protein
MKAHNRLMAAPTLSPDARTALEALASDLREIFGNRLHSVCAYAVARGSEDGVRSIALVDRLAFDDLAACAPLAARWDARGLAVPLILERDEFARTLDVFPLEYGAIIADHVHIFGEDPFEGLSVAEADLRRACELQAKSHLIHLREGFLETGGDAKAVGRLITASAEGFSRLLTSMVALVASGATPASAEDLAAAAEHHFGVDAPLTREVLAAAAAGPSTIVDQTALLARYVTAVERLWEFVDAWKR